MDYATVDMGKILNDQSDAATESESKVEVLFEVQALLHDSLTVGEVYRVSVGAMYDSQSYVTIAQDDLTYEDWTAQSVSRVPSYIYFNWRPISNENKNRNKKKTERKLNNITVVDQILMDSKKEEDRL